jgi:hypothetical protein
MVRESVFDLDHAYGHRPDSDDKRLIEDIVTCMVERGM